MVGAGLTERGARRMRNVDVHYLVNGGVCIAAFCTERAALRFAEECGEGLIAVRVGSAWLRRGPARA